MGKATPHGFERVSGRVREQRSRRRPRSSFADPSPRWNHRGRGQCLLDAGREDDPTAARAVAWPAPAMGYARSTGLRDHEGRAPRLDPSARVDSRQHAHGHERSLKAITTFGWDDADIRGPAAVSTVILSRVSSDYSRLVGFS